MHTLHLFSDNTKPVIDVLKPVCKKNGKWIVKEGKDEKK